MGKDKMHVNLVVIGHVDATEGDGVPKVGPQQQAVGS